MWAFKLDVSRIEAGLMKVYHPLLSFFSNTPITLYIFPCKMSDLKLPY